VQLRSDEEHSFAGVVDLLRMKAFTFAADESGTTDDEAGAGRARGRGRGGACRIDRDGRRAGRGAAREVTSPKGHLRRRAHRRLRQRSPARDLPVYFCAAATTAASGPIMDALVDLVRTRVPRRSRRERSAATRSSSRPTRRHACRLRVSRRSPTPTRAGSPCCASSRTLASDSVVHQPQRDAVERFGPVAWCRARTSPRSRSWSARHRRRRQAQGDPHRRRR